MTRNKTFSRLDLMGRLRTRGAAFAHDLFMVPIAWLAAHWFRFNLGAIPADTLEAAIAVLPLLLVIQGMTFWYFGLYRGIWRFASVPDLLRIIQAVAVGVALSAVGIFLMTRMAGLPRSVLVLYGILLSGLLGGPRLLYRWTKDRAVYRRPGERALIVGAGRAGEMLARDLRRDPSHGCLPAVFVDDDPAKQRKEIHGVPVVGTCEEIPRIAEREDVDLILIAVPSATTSQMQHLVELCEQTGLPLRTMPRLGDLVAGRASVSQLHEVSIEDLLGREPIQLDWDSLRKGLAGRRVLVTGGGGSIGAELCRQIAQLGPSELIVLEKSEYALYEIERELQERFPEMALKARLGDVCDAVGVEALIDQCRPEVIFHAAAYKHVPVLEEQIREAVRNNLMGTNVVAEAADRYGVEAFVLISTDKAVNPGNVMGATKRAAEALCQFYGRHSGTRFVTVRFGNVLGSNGSVVPLFRSQIERGGPVTVTHPEITRYFMTIPEATQLILQAEVMGRGGEIFVLNMGEPIRIQYLAEQMIRLSGRTPYEDIDITFTGLRPGEKLYEELFHPDEALAPTEHEKILLAHARSVEESQLRELLDSIEHAIEVADNDEIYQLLIRMVPEFRSEGAAEDDVATKVVEFPGSQQVKRP